VDELVAVLVVLSVLGFAIAANGSAWVASNAIVVTPSAILAGVTALAAASHRRRDIMHKLGPLYTMTQDICRTGLSFPFNPPMFNDITNDITVWWRLVREVSPLLGKRGRQLLSALHTDLQEITKPVPTGEPRPNCDISRLKRMATTRTLLTEDRDVLLTRWPEKLDFIRLRLPFRSGDMNSGLSS
jgi:hypothetical protein